MHELLNYVTTDPLHPPPQTLVTLVELTPLVHEVFVQCHSQLLSHALHLQLPYQPQQVLLVQFSIRMVLLIEDQVALILLNCSLTLMCLCLPLPVYLTEEVLNQLLLQV